MLTVVEYSLLHHDNLRMCRGRLQIGLKTEEEDCSTLPKRLGKVSICCKIPEEKKTVGSKVQEGTRVEGHKQSRYLLLAFRRVKQRETKGRKSRPSPFSV